MSVVAVKRKPRKGLSRSPRKVEVRIVMPRRPAYWTWRRFAALLVLAFVFAANGVVFSAGHEGVPKQAARIGGHGVTAAAEPFDIILDGTSPEQKDMAAAESESGKTAKQAAKRAPAAVEVKVKDSADGDSDADAASPQESEAQSLLQKAAQHKLRGEYKKALRLTHRAAALVPDNMDYRLELATLYDRTGEIKGAITLYHQVLAAHAADEETLSADADVSGIRERVSFLENSSSTAKLPRVAAR